VIEGYELDKRSRAKWEQRSQDAMDLALQVTENKSWPWANAANVKLPLITTAAIQFHARAYPAIVPGQQIVKGVPMGADPQGVKLERGDRIGKHMSYQVLEEMPDWEEDTDKLLLNVSIVGCAFRKTYFDHTVGANRSEMVVAKHLVVNHRTKNLGGRSTHHRGGAALQERHRGAHALRPLPPGRPRAQELQRGRRPEPRLPRMPHVVRPRRRRLPRALHLRGAQGFEDGGEGHRALRVRWDHGRQRRARGEDRARALLHQVLAHPEPGWRLLRRWPRLPAQPAERDGQYADEPDARRGHVEHHRRRLHRQGLEAEGRAGAASRRASSSRSTRRARRSRKTSCR
jgi:hypothetical protein